jgi:hypothetical protein
MSKHGDQDKKHSRKGGKDESKAGEASQDAGSQPAADQARGGEVQGEGDYEAGRRYVKATREFVASGQVDPAAREAAPRDADQARELDDAQAEGQAHAKGEDPGVSSKARRAAARP